jgi:hypothetical protein
VNRHTLPHLNCTGTGWRVARVAQVSRLPESEVVEEIIETDHLIREIEGRSNSTGIEYARTYRDCLMQMRRG